MRPPILICLAVFTLVKAIEPPDLANMKVLWSDSFVGCAGCSPDFITWTVPPPYVHTNNELQTYTSFPSNLQLSGNETLQIIPRKDKEGWTSSRIESVPSWTPSSGKLTQVQASFRAGSGGAGGKQGMWPAFWMLGDSNRHGVLWPLCGEIDVFEQINGITRGYGTIHCEQSPLCGISRPVVIPNDNFNTWAIKFDRRPTTWQAETLEWSIDGIQFSILTGADIGNLDTWSTLVYSLMYIIFNLAVGGSWPITIPMHYMP